MTVSAETKERPIVTRISGPIVTATGMHGASMYEVVRVADEGLIGEVVRLVGGRATIQVYEDTTMLKPGAPIEQTGAPLSVWLGPGLLGNIYDGIQRPLPGIQDRSGAWIARGERVDPLDSAKKWPFEPAGQGGRYRRGRPDPRHRAGDGPRQAPDPGAAGRSGQSEVHRAGGRVHDPGRVAVVETADGPKDLRLFHKWPVRHAAAHPRAPSHRPAARDRPADHRHVLPHRQGRHGGHPRRVRHGQDHHAAPVGQVVRRRDHRLHRLRRTRQRDDRGPARVPGTEGPAQRPAADGADDPDRQHLQHAGGGPRGLHLHGHHAGRVLPRHGLQRGRVRRLDEPLGRGAA